MRIEMVVEVIDRPQTSRVVDREQDIDLGMARTLSYHPTLPLVAIAIRFVVGRSVIAGVGGTAAGWGQGSVGRPPRTELTASSDLGMEVVVDGVVGFGCFRTDYSLVVHGSIVRTVFGPLVYVDRLGRFAGTQRWTRNEQVEWGSEGRLEQTVVSAEQCIAGKLSSRLSQCD